MFCGFVAVQVVVLPPDGSKASMYFVLEQLMGQLPKVSLERMGGCFGDLVCVGDGFVEANALQRTVLTVFMCLINMLEVWFGTLLLGRFAMHVRSFSGTCAQGVVS